MTIPSMLDQFNGSLEYIAAFEDLVPEIGDFASRLLIKNYQDFINRLYVNIDKIISELQKNPEILQHDSEDRLSISIKSSLNSMGYKASHDQKIGGHCDLIVEGRYNWIWIGEAKIYNGYQYLMKGFNQLTTRYSTGDLNQNHGGLIIYIKKLNAAEIMNKWGDTLKEEGITNISDCNIRPKLSFYSQHLHERSGLNFHVRHMAVMLGFEPKDKK